MSGVKQYNPNSRATEIIAALALREPLHSIERICDEQEQISTARLYAYATEAGDKLAGYACELRQAITSLRQDHAEAQRLLRENDALAQRCRDLSEALETERAAAKAFQDGYDYLRAEVERLRQSLRSVIVAAGGSAAPDVSAEFLELAPLEVLALRGNLDQLQARLRRIESIAECGSVQSWLALPDEAKAKWFGLHAEQDGERLRLRAEVERLRSLPARLQQIVTTRHESTAALAARVRNTLEDYQ